MPFSVERAAGSRLRAEHPDPSKGSRCDTSAVPAVAGISPASGNAGVTACSPCMLAAVPATLGEALIGCIGQASCDRVHSTIAAPAAKARQHRTRPLRDGHRNQQAMPARRVCERRRSFPHSARQSSARARSRRRRQGVFSQQRLGYETKHSCRVTRVSEPRHLKAMPYDKPGVKRPTQNALTALTVCCCSPHIDHSFDSRRYITVSTQPRVRNCS